RCTVTLMSGLPGVGKDTWLARNCPELPVVSLDNLRETLEVDATDNQGAVIQAARESCREHLRAGRDFAFNATNTMKPTRRQWVARFAVAGAGGELFSTDPRLLPLYEKNARRSLPVPRKVIERLLAKLEPPTWAEAHSLSLVS